MISGTLPHPLPLSGTERGGKARETVTVAAGVPKELLKHARRNRKNQTRAETLLWQSVRNRKFHRWKFRRQHPISGFVLDFYCAETRVAVELDGVHHTFEDQKRYDENRTAILAEYGIRVLRIPNSDVLDNKEKVLQRIADFTSSPLSKMERGRG